MKINDGEEGKKASKELNDAMWSIRKLYDPENIDSLEDSLDDTLSKFNKLSETLRRSAEVSGLAKRKLKNPRQSDGKLF